MSRQLVRVSLVIILLAVLVASTYRVFLIEQQVDADRDAERAFSALTWELGLSLGDLRAAQQAYVAAGQDRTYWVEKVSLHLADITTDLAHLMVLSTIPGSGDALAEVGSAVESVARIDELAREHTAAGQDLMASDLIFADGLELWTRGAEHLELARIGERDAHDRLRQGQRNSQVILLGAALGTSLLVAILLVPAGRRAPAVRSDAATTSEPVAEAQPVADAEIPKSVDDSFESGFDAPAGQLSIDEPAPTVQAVAPDLQTAADLCTDLARLTDTDELPDVLRRAADLLHAAGIIIWVRDESGEALRPAAGHGYSPDALARIGTIRCDGNNATVEAYRTAQLQIVPGKGKTLGAIVAPLLSPNGCIGVMSAEVSEAHEASAAVRAMTAILAAQLATLVAADPPAQAELAQGERRG